MNSSMGAYTGARNLRGSRTGDIIPKGYRTGQLQQFTPEQQNLFSQLFSQVSPESYLSRLSQGDESLFNEMEAPALRQFQGLQGNLASRFSGMGTGARNSSGFRNTVNQATSDFVSDLASRRQELQRQALMDLMGISNSLLGQRPQERFLTQKQSKRQGLDLMGLGGGLLGSLGGFLSGGPTGAVTGASLGYGIGSGRGSNTFFRNEG